MKWSKRTAQGFSPGDGYVVSPTLLVRRSLGEGGKGRPNRLNARHDWLTSCIFGSPVQGDYLMMAIPRAEALGCIVGPLRGQEPEFNNLIGSARPRYTSGSARLSAQDSVEQFRNQRSVPAPCNSGASPHQFL